MDVGRERERENMSLRGQTAREREKREEMEKDRGVVGVIYERQRHKSLENGVWIKRERDGKRQTEKRQVQKSPHDTPRQPETEAVSKT